MSMLGSACESRQAAIRFSGAISFTRVRLPTRGRVSLTSSLRGGADRTAGQSRSIAVGRAVGTGQPGGWFCVLGRI